MLKRVSIQNFKSLKDVTLDLQKVNLLIGPNNSGKTNFLKALEFCSNTNTIQDKEIDTLQRNTRINPTYEEEIYYEQEKQKFNHWVYRKDQSLTILIDIYDQGSLIITTYKVHWSAKARQARHMPNNSDSGLDSDGAFQKLRTYLRFIYKPDPNKLTQPGPVGIGEETINADASNLVGFLDLMLGKYRRTTFSQIETDLHKCIPEFVEVVLDDVKPTQDLTKIHGENKASFKRIGLTDGRQNTQYWADELSEGTLYFIALLCIINQPNPPKLLLLEEPEKGIHPRRIWEVMKFIFQLAEEKDIQIIMTTHNEHVVNAFSSMPESVFVFSKDEEGATHVKNLQKDIIEPSHQRSRETGTKEIDFTSNLGENWMYGLLGGVPEEIL